MSGTKSKLTAFFLFASMIFLAVKSQEIIVAVQNSLKLCFSSIIPSLFPFMILSSIYVSTIDESSFKCLSFFTRKLFGITSYGTGALICGIICGYPIGPRCACQLYTDKKISASEAESLIAYSNNCGPLFVIGAVGCAMLNSLKQGIVLYAVQILCSLLTAIILKPFTYSKVLFGNTHKNIKSFTNAICDSTYSIINVCGYIVFFSVVGVFINQLSVCFPLWLRCFINTVPEITNGINFITKSTLSHESKMALISMALNWCGISVHMQVKSIVSKTDLSLKKYFAVKIASSALSGITSYIIFGGIDNIVLLNPIYRTGIIIMLSTVIILFFAQKKRGKILSFKN